ncbi:dipeptidase 1-like [Trichoplusia ni]|uniref:Dipeptidase n=1 Tax=Trichoplusia ni TaxID=7111 RepID=A0A7E5WBT7_TRINI|nr:dipeptidase 1-like [Trichoplusia ni]
MTQIDIIGLSVWHRRWCCVAILVLVAGTACVAGPLALRAPPGAPLHERLRLAERLLHDTPLIDGHNDLPWNIRKFLHNRIKDFNFDEDLRTISPWATSSWSHTDLPRLKQGRVAAQFWAAYVPCDAQHRDAVQLTFEQIDLIQRLTDKYHPQLTLCTSAQDIVTAHANHRLCSLVGVEGGHAIGGSLGVLRTLYQVGVRYLTLTSTCDTPWAECASGDKPEPSPRGGLTPFGKIVVKEMNRLGMLVDLSHVSERTMRDALAVSRAPVLFSHSSARALCNVTRNVPDSVLRLLAANKGLIMVNFYTSFLTCKDTATVQDAIAHINHIRDVAGVDSVGLGAGYDGINYTPQGLEDVSSYPLLFAELMEEGWSIEELRKLAGLNLLRVMGAAERVASELASAQVTPYEDVPPKLYDAHNCSSQDL